MAAARRKKLSTGTIGLPANYPLVIRVWASVGKALRIK